MPDHYLNHDKVKKVSFPTWKSTHICSIYKYSTLKCEMLPLFFFFDSCSAIRKVREITASEGDRKRSAPIE
jgi:hypothetical protein